MARKAANLQLQRCDGMGQRQCPRCREWLYPDDFSDDLHPKISDDVKHCIECRSQAMVGLDQQDWNERLRAFHFGVHYEFVSRIRVFERDGWVCHLCSGSVDQALGAMDEQGPTLDHLIPISQGGPHTFDNLRLAHRSCNTAKGAGKP